MPKAEAKARTEGVRDRISVCMASIMAFSMVFGVRIGSIATISEAVISVDFGGCCAVSRYSIVAPNA